jgi:polar amino acid transport system substrate-binding protein
LQPVLVATGEWSPYSGQALPEAGITAAVVTEAFKRMGDAPEFRFMPWERTESATADNESDEGVRAAFPYSFEVARAARFYYSRPIQDVRIALYYSAVNSVEAARIRSVKDLDGFTVIPIRGYASPSELQGHMADMTPVEDNVAAFTLLLKSERRLLVAESQRVGDDVLRTNFPLQADRIAITPLGFNSSLHLIASKRNPDNITLIRDFDRALEAMRLDGTLEQVKTRVSAAVDRRNEVQLQPDAQGRIEAYTDPDHRLSILLPLGTRAVVQRWNDNFLEAKPAGSQTPQLVRIRVLDGPQDGHDYYVDERRVVLP